MTAMTTGTNAVPRRVLRDEVSDYVFDLLLRGELELGSPLHIDPLSRQLGVSPTPIREALAQLEHTGLLRRIALKGYTVAPPLSQRQVEELFDAREVVELAAVHRASAHLQILVPSLAAAHAQHRAAAEHLNTMIGADKPAGYRKYFEAGWSFHETILRNCGNRYLLQMADLTITHSHRMRHNVSQGFSNTDRTLTEHEEILSAFQRNDIAEAAEAMRNHIAKARQRALRAT